MARSIDLDSREVKEIKRGGNILPRAKAIYRVKLLDFLEFETDDNDGYEIKVLIRKVIAPDRQHPDAQPPAEVGDERTYRFKNKFKFKEEKVRTKQDLRTMLCVIYGEEHHEDFEANRALTALMKLADRDKLDDLDEFWIVSEIWPGKKADPDTGKHFINQRLNAHLLEWKPGADAYRKNGADSDDEDDAPRRGRSTGRRKPTDDEDDDRPARGRTRRADPDDEEDDRPARGRARKTAEEDGDPPPRRTRSRAADDDEEDERPARGRSSSRRADPDEDDEDDRPTRRRR